LYVDDLAAIQFPSDNLTGSEVAAIPYSYTVGS
jgi:hypothetical protein